MSKIEVNTIESQCGSTVTLGKSGDTVTLASGASQSGFGRTGTVDWDTTKKTASFTAVSGNGYFIDTSSSAITMTLPASPSAGDIVSVKDYAYTFSTNNLSVAPNGSNIGGGSDFNQTYSNDGTFLTFIYVDSTKGWLVTDEANNTSDSTNVYVAATGGTVITCGNFKTHIFTSPGTFCVTAASGPVATVDYFVIGGAGGGGRDNFPAPRQGGGGGAGGFRMSNSLGLPAPLNSPLANPTGLPVTIQGYPITVGGGGVGGDSTTGATVCGGVGSNSSFSTIASAGGGGGQGHNSGYGICFPNPHSNSNNGGSGGGIGADQPNPQGRGTGNTPPVSPPQGNNSGPVYAGPPSHFASGAGGAGAVGGDGSQPAGGDGGIGSFLDNNAIGPTAPSYGEAGPVSNVRYFSGGGGSQPGGCGGAGGGGNAGSAGTANTGGGGGGNRGTNGSAGGSGIVIIRYQFQSS